MVCTRILGTVLLLQACVAFHSSPLLFRPNIRASNRASVLSVKAYSEPGKSWQDVAEQLADPFIIDPVKKVNLAVELIGMRQDVASSLRKVARREAQVEDELLGTRQKKQLKAARIVQRQLREDIIPNALNEIRSLTDVRDSGRDVGISNVTKFAQDFRSFVSETIDEISAEGKFPVLPRPDELVKTINQEARNILLGELNDLELPSYTVVNKSTEFEIRDYEPMTLASLKMGNQNESSVQRNGRAFNALAGFLFGKNSDKKSMSMTSPVFIDWSDTQKEKMSFVIPKRDADDVPMPTDSSILIEVTRPVRVAVREFPGFATEKEVVMQKEALIEALKQEGYQVPVIPQMTVAQYNQPITVPTVRRNEIIVKLDAMPELDDAAPGSALDESDGVDGSMANFAFSDNKDSYSIDAFSQEGPSE